MGLLIMRRSARYRTIALLALLIVSPVTMTSAAADQREELINPSMASCRDIVPPRITSNSSRPVQPRDLLEIRDFGSSAVSEGLAPGFATSPDGQALVVQVRRAEADSNTYCQAVLLYDLWDSGASPRVLNIGGEFVREHINLYGLQPFPTGMSLALTPKWSPDGRWIAFLRRENGVTRLLVVSPNTGDAEAVSPSATDVVDFHWDSQGSAITFETSEIDSHEQKRSRDESRSGYRYDLRFWTLATTVPFEETERRREHYRAVLPSSGAWKDARVENILLQVDRRSNDIAFIETDATPLGAYQTRIHARLNGQIYRCADATCTSAAAAWFSSSLGRVIFLRREGFASATTGIYAWTPGPDTPTKIGETDDALTGCQLERNLICGREASLRPRDIAEIDLRTGSIRSLVDLNPEWKSLNPVRVTRLRWTNPVGLEAIGDLVLPAATEATKPYPLVVVQYDTRGFLRGGTGDEYPIQAIAAAGFAVLSVSRPLDYQIAMARRGRPVSRREAIEKRLDRASVHSSLIEGIRQAAQIVDLDNSHFAITGLSDGASASTYALIHSKIFSLALLSTCCEDPQITMTSIGPSYERKLETRGYEFQFEENWPGWKRSSLAMNAERICARIVIQAADREARMALASYASLRRAGVDIEMFVFPDEHHIKWQPAHRMAIYQRSLSELAHWAGKPPTKCIAQR